MLKCTKGHIPQEAQNGIKDTLVNDGYFLACACTPSEDLYISLPDESALFSKATVLEKNRLAPHIYQILLDPVTPLYYHAGQFINLHRQDGLSRSYSLASHPQQDRVLEIHVGRHSQGHMSNWIFDEFKEGDCIDIQGPNGGCYYLANKQEMPLLLIGTGTGLAPLVGILKDALYSKHVGDIYLYHGSRLVDGQYLKSMLRSMEKEYQRFHYTPCISGDVMDNDSVAGRACNTAFKEHTDLEGCRVYLCGDPSMVHSAKKRAYLAGAALSDIYTDPYELTPIPSS